jgi:hypothetical protein
MKKSGAQKKDATVSQFYSWVDKKFREIHDPQHKWSDQEIRNHWISTESLNIPNILQKLFNMPDACAKALLSPETKYPANPNETLSENAHQWLSKMFDGTGGCLSDVVNLCMAMVYPDQRDYSALPTSEQWKIAKQQVDLALKGDKSALSKLWLPPTLLMDSELDDRLAMILLVRLRQLRKQKLQMPTNPLRVIVQVGTSEKFEGVEDKIYENMKDVEELVTFEIMRDNEAKNDAALRDYFGLEEKK